MQKIIYRDPDHKIVGGVAAGIAEYLQLDISLVRVLFVALVFFGKLGISTALVVYFVFWAIVPKKPSLPAPFKPFNPLNPPNPGPQSPQGAQTAGEAPSNPLMTADRSLSNPLEANYRVGEDPGTPYYSGSGQGIAPYPGSGQGIAPDPGSGQGIAPEPGSGQGISPDPSRTSTDAPMGTSPGKPTAKNGVAGVILVSLGLLLLADQYIDWDWSWIDHYWPVGLVCLGVFLLVTGDKRKKI